MTFNVLGASLGEDPRQSFNIIRETRIYDGLLVEFLASFQCTTELLINRVVHFISIVNFSVTSVVILFPFGIRRQEASTIHFHPSTTLHLKPL
jgi:hypothetical protein